MRNLNIKNYSSKLFSLINKFTNRVPLSNRGMIALVLSIVCFFYFGLKESDLVASIVAVCLFVSIFMAAIILTLTSRNIFKTFKNFAKTQGQNTSGEKIYAQVETPLPLLVPNLKIAPLTSLTIKREFKNKTVQSKKITLRGTDNTGEIFAYIYDSIHFPHRGIYNQDGLHLEYSDVLGLCKIKKYIHAPRTISVYPKEIQVQSLPIMAASAQLGDIDHATVERTGDLFDIREYQAGDSLKRVLWKVYAKSGNLVVRQPEPAIIPEGEVAVFCFANTENDKTASAFLSYLKILDEQNIVYTTSCLGNIHDTAKTIPQAEQVILESAEYAFTDTGDSFSAFVENIKKHNHSIHKVIGFFPKSFLDDAQTSNQKKLSQNIRQVMNSSATDLIVARVDEKSADFKFETQTDKTFLSNLDKKISNLYDKNLLSFSQKLSKLRGKTESNNSKFQNDTFRDQEVIEVGTTNA